MSSLSKNGDFCEFNKWLRTQFVKKPAHAGIINLGCAKFIIKPRISLRPF